MDNHKSWEERIRQRLQEYQDSDEELFKQWAYTGHFRDHGRPSAVCEMCGNTGLRYHYLVAHRKTGEAIWVGSQCVLNFDFGEGAHTQRKRTESATLQAQREEIHQDRVEGVIKQLQSVYHLANDGEKRKMRWIVGKFQRRGVFSPADASWLLQVMLVCRVQPDVQNIPISLRTKKEKAELRLLSITELNLLAACLTEEQKQLCAQLGVRLNF